MGSHTRFIIKALVVATLVSIALPAGAEDGRHGGFRGGGDISHFDGHDYAVWRSGGWHHEFHDGRWGWWWVVAGVWYFYPEPIYPYPDPYVPPVVVTQPVVQPAPRRPSSGISVPQPTVIILTYLHVPAAGGQYSLLHLPLHLVHHHTHRSGDEGYRRDFHGVSQCCLLCGAACVRWLHRDWPNRSQGGGNAGPRQTVRSVRS